MDRLSPPGKRRRERPRWQSKFEWRRWPIARRSASLSPSPPAGLANRITAMMSLRLPCKAYGDSIHNSLGMERISWSTQTTSWQRAAAGASGALCSVRIKTNRAIQPVSIQLSTRPASGHSSYDRNLRDKALDQHYWRVAKRKRDKQAFGPFHWDQPYQASAFMRPMVLSQGHPSIMIAGTGY